MKILMVAPIEDSGGVATHAKELSKNLREIGNEVEIYNISPTKKIFYIFEYLIKFYKRTFRLLLKIIKNNKNFDLIHVQSSGPLGGFIPAIVTAFLKKILGFKLVVTFHYRADKQFIIMYKYFFELVLIHTNHLFVVSKKQLHNFNEVFNKNFSNKISVISNGFDPKSFYPMEMTKIRKKLNLPEDKKIILNVGNLLEVKGQKYLIKAIKEVKEKIPNLFCVIIGDGSLKECLEKKVQDLKMEKYVKIIGAKPHNEIPLWMNAADLFVLPSLNEGNPTVMFECLACGKPFIGTKVGGIPEIIVSEDYGLLCEPANPGDLKENILQALSKEWDHKKILKYAEKFTWDNISKKILEIYSSGV